jgi:uncharacterized damage-inducible protein DinB
VTAEEVRARIRDKRQELVDLIATLEPAELGQPDSGGGWAIKDHLVHIAAWEHWLLALFERRDLLEAMGAAGAGRNVDQINSVVFETHRHESVKQGLAYFRDAHEQLMRVLDRQTTEDFERPYRVFFPPADGEAAETPVLEAVAANTYDHYAEHIGWIKQMRANSTPR